VGPAGQLLDRALADAGVPPESVFVTNVVKHFRWSGTRRQTKDPPVPEPGARGRVRSVAGRRAQHGATARHRPAGRDRQARQSSVRRSGWVSPGPDGGLAGRLPGGDRRDAGPGLGAAHAASGSGPALAEAGRDYGTLVDDLSLARSELATG
jgi:hypothetical protein